MTEENSQKIAQLLSRNRIIDTGSYRKWRLFLIWCLSKDSLNLSFDILYYTGGTPGNSWGGGVQHGSSNPDPISDQKM